MKHKNDFYAADAILEAERRLILEGSFAALEEMSAQKEKIFSSLTLRQDRPSLERLRDKMQYNARLLESARAGFLSAVRQLKDIRNGGQKMRIYDRAGACHALETNIPSSGLETKI